MNNLKERATHGLDHNIIFEIELKYKDDPFVMALIRGVKDARSESMREFEADLCAANEENVSLEEEVEELQFSIDLAAKKLTAFKDASGEGELRDLIKEALDELSR